MEPQQFAQPPFSDIHADSVFGLFNDEQVKVISSKIQWINHNAEPMNEEVVMDKAADQKPSY